MYYNYNKNDSDDNNYNTTNNDTKAAQPAALRAAAPLRSCAAWKQ